MTQSVAEILNGAADYLETNGWLAGHMFGYGDAPHSCAVGAIVVAEFPSVLTAERRISACYDTATRSAAMDSMAQALGTGSLDAVSRVSSWNDRAGRTAQEVIAKLREVAAANA